MKNYYIILFLILNFSFIKKTQNINFKTKISSTEEDKIKENLDFNELEDFNENDLKNSSNKKAEKNDFNDHTKIKEDNQKKQEEFYKTEFNNWRKMFKKQYKENSKEYKQRFDSFKLNFKMIDNHNNNSNTLEKKNTFVMGLGPFADMSYSEFRRNILRKKDNEENDEIDVLMEEKFHKMK